MSSTTKCYRARLKSLPAHNLESQIAMEMAENGEHRMAVLLRHGVDPDVPRFGQTALHFAAAWHGDLPGDDRARFASTLLDHNARLDLRDDLLKSTPLGWACR